MRGTRSERKVQFASKLRHYKPRTGLWEPTVDYTDKLHGYAFLRRFCTKQPRDFRKLRAIATVTTRYRSIKFLFEFSTDFIHSTFYSYLLIKTKTVVQSGKRENKN